MKIPRSARDELLQSQFVQKTVYLSLGSNLGDRRLQIEIAIQKLSELGTIKTRSSLYETEPVDVPPAKPQPWFLNCCVALETELMPRQLLKAVLEIEQQMGRKRGPQKSSRSIDIDILLFGNSMVETKGLTIPHPRMHERRFVLEPLTEIAPDVLHPGLRQTGRQLRDALPPGAQVRRLP